jgi:hypothetical protein
VFQVTCEHHYNIFENLTKLIQSSGSAAILFSDKCKWSLDNLNLFCDSWESQINDLSILVKEMHDLTVDNAQTSFSSNSTSRSDESRIGRERVTNNNSRKSYLSLTRNRSASSSRNKIVSSPSSKQKLMNQSKLDPLEKAKIAKLGLEMKLITNEIEVEANKWNEPQNEIVKLARMMSTMAFEIHLFTRGDGVLKTTHDFFNKAEEFLQLGLLFYNNVKEFMGEVPAGYMKIELVELLEKMPYNYQQLKDTLRQITSGKTATFNKVN